MTKIIGTVCHELEVLLPLKWCLQRSGPSLGSTRSQVPSSKRLWCIRTAIKQKQDGLCLLWIRSSWQLKLQSCHLHSEKVTLTTEPWRNRNGSRYSDVVAQGRWFNCAMTQALSNLTLRVHYCKKYIYIYIAGKLHRLTPIDCNMLTIGYIRWQLFPHL